MQKKKDANEGHVDEIKEFRIHPVERNCSSCLGLTQLKFPTYRASPDQVGQNSSQTEFTVLVTDLHIIIIIIMTVLY